jgi:hypothetical protein
MRPLKLLFLLAFLLLLAPPALAGSCPLPDNGSGTVDLPPDCPDGYVGVLTIIDGLPPGTTITGEAVLTDYHSQNSTPGGSLGGEVHTFGATLHWTATGTGDLTGFVRNLAIPAYCEMHTGPRNPGDPVQTFDNDMFHMTAVLFGDPDFCDFFITAGTNNGLPSPGSTTLTELPGGGDFNVDSFFDITYEIEFAGCPGSILEGLAGTTTATDRYQAGEPYFPPNDYSCPLPDNGTGTVDLPPDCPDGYEGILTIIDGLPPGTTITGEAVLTDYHSQNSTPGGSLGGEVHTFGAALHWTATGTGDLTGFVRNLAILVTCEMHTGPRNPGDPVQTFDNDMFSMTGVLYGDPDFCDLFITAGTNNGLPSPGSTTLTELPGDEFNVDSFFDITYEIEFTGCPGSILEGLAGTTTATDRYQAGEPYFPPNDFSCPLPDNGTGTVDLPPDCPDGYEGILTIIDGLPPGTTITGEAVLTDYHSQNSTSGGSLGGEVHTFGAALHWTATGTGDLTGFVRNLAIPVNCEMHTGPRNPGDPVQTFDNDMFYMAGVLYGDPDFCDLFITAGTNNGLPSPGSTTLTELPDGDFNVDSFFDITYQIEFTGCPGSILEGLTGTTTATDRYQAGEKYYVSAVGQVQPPLISLFQNAPNPFNPMTVIRYELPAGGSHVALDIFDVRGRHVRNLVDGRRTGGLKSVVWNGRDADGRRASSGVYFYALVTEQGTLIRKMAIIK